MLSFAMVKVDSIRAVRPTYQDKVVATVTAAVAPARPVSHFDFIPFHQQ